MAVKKGGLGKGLDSLIPSGTPKNKKSVTEGIQDSCFNFYNTNSLSMNFSFYTI